MLLESLLLTLYSARSRRFQALYAIAEALLVLSSQTPYERSACDCCCACTFACCFALFCFFR